MLELYEAVTPAHFDDALALMDEYVAWDMERTRALGLDVDRFLEFYVGEKEGAASGEFDAPAGRLVLASWDGRVAGCGAFRRFTPDSCEVKRVYVRPEFRGKRVGRAIVVELIAKAVAAGYRRMWLETTVFMQGAQEMYLDLGFRACEPYYEIPHEFRPITRFMERPLS